MVRDYDDEEWKKDFFMNIKSDGYNFNCEQNIWDQCRKPTLEELQSLLPDYDIKVKK